MFTVLATRASVHRSCNGLLTTATLIKFRLIIEFSWSGPTVKYKTALSIFPNIYTQTHLHAPVYFACLVLGCVRVYGTRNYKWLYRKLLRSSAKWLHNSENSTNSQTRESRHLFDTQMPEVLLQFIWPIYSKLDPLILLSAPSKTPLVGVWGLGFGLDNCWVQSQIKPQS